MSINTYKAISNRLYIWGLKPVDLGGVVLFSFLVWGFSNSLFVMIFSFFVSYYLAKKLKNREDCFLKSFIRFISLPNKFGVDLKDIPSYKNICKK